MGLGKTVQTLALICHAREPARRRRAVPGGRADQRGRQLGPPRPRGSRPACGSCAGTESGRRAAGRRWPSSIAGADLVVTSYALFRLDIDATTSTAVARADPGRGAVRQEPPARRPTSAPGGSTAPFKLAITGTPLENNLMELWSLLSITAPGPVPARRERFTEYYRLPDRAGRRPGRLDRLRRRIRPLMLRRTKEQVAAELPPKQEQVRRGRAAPAAPAGLPDASAAGAAEGARADRRRWTATGSRSCGR